MAAPSDSESSVHGANVGEDDTRIRAVGVCNRAPVNLEPSTRQGKVRQRIPIIQSSVRPGSRRADTLEVIRQLRRQSARVAGFHEMDNAVPTQELHAVLSKLNELTGRTAAAIHQQWHKLCLVPIVLRYAGTPCSDKVQARLDLLHHTSLTVAFPLLSSIGTNNKS